MCLNFYFESDFKETVRACETFAGSVPAPEVADGPIFEVSPGSYDAHPAEAVSTGDTFPGIVRAPEGEAVRISSFDDATFAVFPEATTPTPGDVLSAFSSFQGTDGHIVDCNF